MPRFALSALGVDRPGIVAALSGALAERGCNLEDSTMTVLRGHFAVLLVLGAPEGETASSLEESLAGPAASFDLVVSVRPLADLGTAGSSGGPPPQAVPGTGRGETWTVSVHGADHPGIVHGIATAIADAGGNISDLSTHLVGEQSSPVYAMVMQVGFEAGAGSEALARVRIAAEDLGVSCHIRLHDPEVL
jgi:glycine cleavage system transcriptional repressor